jgi:hypothetical protein
MVMVFFEQNQYCITVCPYSVIFFFSMSHSKPKGFNPTDMKRIYKQAYRDKFDWQSLLPDALFVYLDILEKARCS